MHVRKVEAGGRLVQYVDRASGAAARKFGREFNALCLAARELGARLPEADVGEAHIHQGLHLPRDARHVLEEAAGLFYRHVEHVVDGLSLVAHFEGLAVIALAAADLAGHIDVRQEVHLDLHDAVARTGLAAPALDVKAEASLLIAARLRIRRRRKEVSNQIEDARIGCGIGTRRSADRGLVDCDDLVELAVPLDALKRARVFVCAV